MAQSVACRPLDFSSGHDLIVHGLEPHVRLHADCVEPAWDCLSPSLSAPLLLTQTLSKLKIKKKTYVGSKHWQEVTETRDVSNLFPCGFPVLGLPADPTSSWSIVHTALGAWPAKPNPSKDLNCKTFFQKPRMHPRFCLLTNCLGAEEKGTRNKCGPHPWVTQQVTFWRKEASKMSFMILFIQRFFSLQFG